MKKAIVLLISFFSIAQAQTAISTGLFDDSSNHWYNFTNKHNIINPVPNQPRYTELGYIKIADNILYFQRNNGGWPKNYDVRAILTQKQIDTIIKTKSQVNTTFDNGTTYTHIDYLAQVYSLTQIEKYKEACVKGIDFILEAQYENGGWPQYYPLRKNYSHYLTFNDGATLGIMNLFKEIIDNNPNFNFIDSKTKKRVITAYEKGLECILKMQIKDDQGNLTVWSQQHDVVTLLPTWGRSYEPPGICNNESCDVVLFLMDIDNPSKAVVNAIQSAVKWFSDSKIANTKVETFKAPQIDSKYTTHPIKVDRKVVTDTKTPLIWTRFYELKSGKPLFCDRNSKFLYSFSELSRERRTGYSWYTYKPLRVLKKYEIWKNKWAPVPAKK